MNRAVQSVTFAESPQVRCSRKKFLGGAAAFAAAPAFAKRPEEIRSVLLHWGLNMWGASLPPDIKGPLVHGRLCNDKVMFSDKAWNLLVDDMVAKKMNMVIIDLGEFPVYPSHPELALPGSRSPDWVRGEVRRLKSLGLEPIPKLNFSTGHDSWLGEYSRMISTRTYYQVCRDVIKDAAEMFDHPRFLHIGYDEENFGGQQAFKCVRVDELWWHDFLYFVKTVEENGMRPWMWSDYGWDHADFVEKCPKSVLQSNWNYSDLDGYDLSKFKPGSNRLKVFKLFLDLEKAGFDQVPCGSNWKSDRYKKEGPAVNNSIAGLVKFCRDNISAGHLKGFMMAPWADCTDVSNKTNLEGIDLLAKALA